MLNPSTASLSGNLPYQLSGLHPRASMCTLLVPVDMVHFNRFFHLTFDYSFLMFLEPDFK